MSIIQKMPCISLLYLPADVRRAGQSCNVYLEVQVMKYVSNISPIYDVKQQQTLCNASNGEYTTTITVENYKYTRMERYSWKSGATLTGMMDASRDVTSF